MYSYDGGRRLGIYRPSTPQNTSTNHYQQRLQDITVATSAGWSFGDGFSAVGFNDDRPTPSAVSTPHHRSSRGQQQSPVSISSSSNSHGLSPSNHAQKRARSPSNIPDILNKRRQRDGHRNNVTYVPERPNTPFSHENYRHTTPSYVQTPHGQMMTPSTPAFSSMEAKPRMPNDFLPLGFTTTPQEDPSRYYTPNLCPQPVVYYSSGDPSKSASRILHLSATSIKTTDAT